MELPSFRLTTTIIKLSVRWCVWKVGEGFPGRVILYRQVSLTRQVFLITPSRDARYKTGKTLTPKSSAMKSYVKLMRHPQHW